MQSLKTKQVSAKKATVQPASPAVAVETASAKSAQKDQPTQTFVSPAKGAGALSTFESEMLMEWATS